MILSKNNKEVTIELKKATCKKDKVAVFYNGEFEKYIDIEEAILLASNLLKDDFKVWYF